MLDREAEGSGGEKECGGERFVDRMALLGGALGGFRIGGASDVEKSLRAVRGIGNPGLRESVTNEQSPTTSIRRIGYFRFLPMFRKRDAAEYKVLSSKEPSRWKRVNEDELEHPPKNWSTFLAPGSAP